MEALPEGVANRWLLHREVGWTGFFWTGTRRLPPKSGLSNLGNAALAARYLRQRGPGAVNRISKRLKLPRNARAMQGDSPKTGRVRSRTETFQCYITLA